MSEIFKLDIDGYRFDEEKIGHRPPALTDELIEYVAELLAKRYRKSAIKQSMALLLGHDCDNVLYGITVRYARLWLRYNYEKRTIDDQKATGLAFYEGVLSDPKEPTHLKLRAQKDMNWMLGIGTQFTHEASDPALTKELVKATILEMEDDCEDPDPT